MICKFADFSEHLKNIRFCLHIMAADRAQIMQHLRAAGIPLVSRPVMDFLVAHPDPVSVISEMKKSGINGLAISVDSLQKNPGRVIAPIAAPETEQISMRNNMPDWKREDFPMDAIDAMIDIKVHYDITGNSITEGKMGDINDAFNDRLERLRKLIIANSNLPRRPMEIARLHAEKADSKEGENIAVAIGLVNDPRHTKNGHLMFNVEDATGEMSCLLMNRKGDDRVIEHAQIVEAGLMPDDVVGVSGTFSQNGDMFYVDDLHFPMQNSHDKKFAEQGVSVAFLSDIHVGSKTFLEAQWHKMVQWFNTDPLARTIKYLVLSGDCVDGVGIYPGQDKELSIKDLYGQYSRFAELLELLPDWVECIMLPGNHDAVRPAEPQPTLEPDIQQDFNTTTFVGNPCDFSLDGVRLLSYHGKSIDDFVAGLRTVTYRDSSRGDATDAKASPLSTSVGWENPTFS